MRNYRLLTMSAALLLLTVVTVSPSFAQDDAPAPTPDTPTYESPAPEQGPAIAPREPGQAPDAPPAGAEGEEVAETPPGGGLFNQQGLFLLVLLGGMILLFVLNSRTRKKQEQKRQEMLGSLKKGDKVTSIGGIVGTVIEVRDDEVVVKVDEQNNVRMRFARWAIRGVGEDAKVQKPEEQK